MSGPLDGFEGQAIWRRFAEVSAIPRGSKNEAAVADHVVAAAKARGLEALRDELHNVVIRVPARGAAEGAPVVVCQAHLDMVCEKNEGSSHDFSRDPIRLLRDGEWLRADGTTLGADNGIGVAAMLALLDSDEAIHGPLELVFTADEETGMSGAIGLDPAWVTGRMLLNLDSEEEGNFTIGCAGGQEMLLELRASSGPVSSGWTAADLRVRGLRGGHSGVDISAARGNALRLLARVLDAFGRDGSFLLFSLDGGSKANAIPREGSAALILPAGDFERLEGTVAACVDAFRAELGRDETDLRVEVEELSAVPDQAFSEEASRRVVDLLLALPHGVQGMSRAMSGLVETSTNLARVSCRSGEAVSILTSQRSSVESRLDEIVTRIRACASLAGASCVGSGRYPAWTPDPESPLLRRAVAVHEALTGRPPKVSAIHAGLECGLFARKWPGMDMISFGPTMRDVHSPDERIHLPSVDGFWKLLMALLAELAS